MLIGYLTEKNSTHKWQQIPPFNPYSKQKKRIADKGSVSAAQTFI